MKNKLPWIVFVVCALFAASFIAFTEGKKAGKASTQYINYMPDTAGVKVIHLNVDPYDIDVKVIISPNVLQSVQILRYWTGDMTIQTNHLNVRGLTIWPDRTTPGLPCIWLPAIPKTAEDNGIIAHEMTHMVHMIMQYVGVTLSEHSDEAYAYLVGYLTRQLYEQI